MIYLAIPVVSLVRWLLEKQQGLYLWIMLSVILLGCGAGIPVHRALFFLESRYSAVTAFKTNMLPFCFSSLRKYLPLVVLKLTGYLQWFYTCGIIYWIAICILTNIFRKNRQILSTVHCIDLLSCLYLMLAFYSNSFFFKNE